MPTMIMIRDLLHADRGIAISIRGISDLVAEYAQSTPGDRLLMFLNQKLGDNFDMDYHACGYNTCVFLRRWMNQNGATFVIITYKYTRPKMSGLHYPFGIEFWGPELTMERLGRGDNIPILQYVYRQIMAVP